MRLFSKKKHSSNIHPYHLSVWLMLVWVSSCPPLAKTACPLQRGTRGCFNCKRRRVKCSEHRPECQGCRRMHSPCVYPAVVLPDPRTVPPASTAKVCLDHLRFFHHFLAEAYPPHPYGASTVWQDVAALSHQMSLFVYLALDVTL